MRIFIMTLKWLFVNLFVVVALTLVGVVILALVSDRFFERCIDQSAIRGNVIYTVNECEQWLIYMVARLIY